MNVVIHYKLFYFFNIYIFLIIFFLHCRKENLKKIIARYKEIDNILEFRKIIEKYFSKLYKN